VVHYSGHGTHVVSDDGEDEAIVPTDLVSESNHIYGLTWLLFQWWCPN
jgi:hypothetical protein